MQKITKIKRRWLYNFPEDFLNLPAITPPTQRIFFTTKTLCDHLSNPESGKGEKKPENEAANLKATKISQCITDYL